MLDPLNTGMNYNWYDEAGQTAFTGTFIPNWLIQLDTSLIIVRDEFSLRGWAPLASTTINNERVFYVLESQTNSQFAPTVPSYIEIPPRLNILHELDLFPYDVDRSP